LPLREDRFSGVTQMVKRRRQDSEKTPVKQGQQPMASEPCKIGASTPYDLVTFCYTSLTL
jgi:hypothetical protein